MDNLTAKIFGYLKNNSEFLCSNYSSKNRSDSDKVITKDEVKAVWFQLTPLLKIEVASHSVNPCSA